jgi:hypothetical protein
MLGKIIRILKFLFYSILTLRRDAVCMFRLAQVKRKIEFFEKNPMSVSQVFNQWVRKQPKKECIVFDDTIWTFQDVNFKNINFHLDDFIGEKSSVLYS